MDKKIILCKCRLLLDAFGKGLLGQTKMPEDSNPGSSKMPKELRLAYFTLPMSLNYQRDSYKLWEAALKTYNDPETMQVFNITYVASEKEDILRSKLLKYKLALQPNKQIHTWVTISKTINNNWGSFSKLFEDSNYDYMKLEYFFQNKYKKFLPYISGAKIFNYWSFIIQKYGGLKLDNSEFIDIAPDTHIIKCSVKLGIITKDEALKLTREEISERWREVLMGSGINPIDMHPPLWFWSRNGFIYML